MYLCDTLVSHFWIVRLSILSVPTLCLKDQQTRSDTIHPELLLTVGVIRWNKVARVLAIQSKMNSPSTINNHLLFDVHTWAREMRDERWERERMMRRERWREREREPVSVYELTQTDTCRPRPTELSECKLLTTDRLANWLLFQNLLIFIYSNSGYWWGWYHLAKLLRQLSRVQISLFLFLQSNSAQTRYESILFTFWPSCVERYALA